MEISIILGPIFVGAVVGLFFLITRAARAIFGSRCRLEEDLGWRCCAGGSLAERSAKSTTVGGRRGWARALGQTPAVGYTKPYVELPANVPFGDLPHEPQPVK